MVICGLLAYAMLKTVLWMLLNPSEVIREMKEIERRERSRPRDFFVNKDGNLEFVPKWTDRLDEREAKKRAAGL